MKFLTLTLVCSLFIASCSKGGGGAAGSGSNAATTAQSPKVSSLSFTKSNLTIVGSQFKDVTSLKIKVNGTESKLSVLSNSGSELVAGIASNLALASGAAFDLIISTASADTTVTGTFILSSGSVTNDMLVGSIDQSKITNLTTDLAAKASLTGATFSGSVVIGQGNEVRFADDNSSNYVGLRSPSSVTSNIVFTLPGVDGATGQVLKTDGAGNLSWVNLPSGAGGATTTDALPEGSNLYFTNARAVTALSGTLASYLTSATAASTYATVANLTTTNTNVTNLTTTVSGKEPAITAGTASQYLKGNKTLGTFATDVVSAMTSSLSNKQDTLTGASDVTVGNIAVSTINGVAFTNLSAYLTSATAASTYATAANLTTTNSKFGAITALPATSGTNGQVLTTNGSGGTSWTTVSGGGGGGPADTDALTEGSINLYFTSSRAVSALSGSLSGKEPSITAGTASQYWKGNKTWGTFATDVASAMTSSLSNKQDVLAMASNVTVGNINTTTLNGAAIPDFSSVLTADYLTNSAVSIGLDATINQLTVGKGHGGNAFNTTLGYQSLASASAGNTGNTAMGYRALKLVTTNYNTAIGSGAISVGVNGSANTALGYEALKNTDQNLNVAIGFKAGKNNTTGAGNTYVGSNAGENDYDTSFNTVVGYQAGMNNSSASYNTLIGAFAGHELYDVTSHDNTIIGNGTAYHLGWGRNNIIIGSKRYTPDSLDEDMNPIDRTGVVPWLQSGNGNLIIGNYDGGAGIDGTNNQILISNGNGNLRLKFDGSGLAYMYNGLQLSGAATFQSDLALTGVLYGNSGIDINGDSVMHGQMTFEQDVTFGSGVIVTGGTFQASDERLKKDIKVIPESLDKIMKLNGVTYNWNDKAVKDLKFKDEPQMGLIAQQVEKIFPRAIKDNSLLKKFKTVNYNMLIAPIIEAIKELKNLFDTHSNEIEQIKAENKMMKDYICSSAAKKPGFCLKK